MAKYRIVVDPEFCIGAASCVTVDPSHFALNEENKAVVLDPISNPPAAPERSSGGRGLQSPISPPQYERILELSDAQKDTLILAAQSCPTLAISIYDEKGRKIFPE